MKTVPLYEGAEKKSYYKFLMPIEHVTDEEVEKIRGLIGKDPSLPPVFADRAVVQTDGYSPAPEGLYFMKDGTLFISTITPMPDVTGEMLQWWLLWHELDPLRYTLWNPEDHYDVRVSAEDRARILNENLTLKERSWGVESHVLESMNGEEPEWHILNFVEPETVGMRNYLPEGARCTYTCTLNNIIKPGPFEIPLFMCNFLRTNDDGINEIVYHLWIGHGVKDGEDISVDLPEPFIKGFVEHFPLMFMIHNHKEMRHLNKVLPAVYAEQKDRPLDAEAENLTL